MNDRDAGLIALGFVAGVAVSALALWTALVQVERGQSIDAMLQRLAARSWLRDVKP